MRQTILWAPALVLGLGAVLTVGIDTQRAMELRTPLGSVIPREIAGFTAKEVVLSEAEARVAGMDEYLMWNYEAGTSSDSTWFSVYIGYYEEQMRGRTIHTPKNCLPGSGWQALASKEVEIETDGEPVRVNQYILQDGAQQVLVFYWYQGRGRVRANEYLVKLDLLRDAALRRRTEEALVRVVVPFGESEQASFAIGEAAVRAIVPSLAAALPS